MQPFLAGFADELTKVGSDVNLMREVAVGSGDPTAKEIVSTSMPAHKRYAQSMLLGAIVAPVMTLLSRRLGRFVHNRDIMKAIGNTVGRGPKNALRAELKTGKFIGSGYGHTPATMPSMTRGELAGDIFTGAASGSIVQALRDKLDKRR